MNFVLIRKRGPRRSQASVKLILRSEPSNNSWIYNKSNQLERYGRLPTLPAYPYGTSVYLFLFSRMMRIGIYNCAIKNLESRDRRYKIITMLN